jgi:hypothetical protein
MELQFKKWMKLYTRNPEQSELAKYHYAQHCNDPPRKWVRGTYF